VSGFLQASFVELKAEAVARYGLLFTGKLDFDETECTVGFFFGRSDPQQ